MPSSGCQTCALRSEEHTSELQSHDNLVCRLLLEKKELLDRKSTRLNSSHTIISYAVFCLKKSTRAPGPAPARPSAPPHRTPPTRRPRASPALRRRGARVGRVRGLDRHGFRCFFFNDTATTEIYTLSLHDALPINDTATTEIYTLSLHDALPISVVAVSFNKEKKAVRSLMLHPAATRAPGVAAGWTGLAEEGHQGRPVTRQLEHRARRDGDHRLRCRAGRETRLGPIDDPRYRDGPQRRAPQHSLVVAGVQVEDGLVVLPYGHRDHEVPQPWHPVERNRLYLR